MRRARTACSRASAPERSGHAAALDVPHGVRRRRRADDRVHKTLDVLTTTGIDEASTRSSPHAAAGIAAVRRDRRVLRRALRAPRAEGEARANLLHDVRDAALARMAAIKRERGLVGFDDLVERVHAALASQHGAHARRRAAPRLLPPRSSTSSRTPTASSGTCSGASTSSTTTTDASRVVPDRRSEAGDLPLPRRRRAHVSRGRRSIAESTETLDRNFRSRPRMIEAVAAVFAEGGEFPFADGETRIPARGARRQGRRCRSRRRQARRAGAASAQSLARRRRAGSTSAQDRCRARASPRQAAASEIDALLNGRTADRAPRRRGLAASSPATSPCSSTATTKPRACSASSRRAASRA